MFQDALAKDPVFTGLQATAVHGHDVYVTDKSYLAHIPLYTVEPGISDKLSKLWLGIIERNHPTEFNKNVTTVWIFGANGRKAFGISSGNCQTL